MDAPVGSEPLGTTPLAARLSGEVRSARERRRAVARLVRRALLVAAGSMTAGAFALAMRPRPVLVDVATVVRGPLVVEIEESGKTRVKDRYVVSAPVAGSLSRVGHEPGDVVKEGDTLAEIAPTLSPLLDDRTRTEAEARLGAALAALSQARTAKARAAAAEELATRELARTRTLARTGTVPAQTLEREEFDARMRREESASATFAEKVAGEEVRMARAALGQDPEHAAKDRHVDVFAPVTGTVLAVHQKSAGVVPPGAPLLEIGDPAALEVVVDLLTTDAVHIEPGTPVAIRGWGEERPLDGRVRLVEPSAFTRPSALGVDEQRVNVVVAFTGPRESFAALGDGYRVEARFVLWRAADVTKVPLGAVFRHGDGWGAYAVRDGIARLVSVAVGHRGEREAEITSGLAAGAAVLVHPGDRVRDGVRVEARR
ncbi:MAG TPA: HlyD family efflux transporter periplasmic adaptor subunit [Polyangiaceae bacterium]|nr:HlyD family efflux transporter periplasmic adaptor subunit [Polyangiaceae bacterium]